MMLTNKEIVLLKVPQGLRPHLFHWNLEPTMGEKCSIAMAYWVIIFARVVLSL
jgi:hypothetical protein